MNLVDKTDAVDPTEAIDLLNTDFTDRGAVFQRFGFDNWTTSALTNKVESLEPYYTSAGTKHLIAGCGTRLEALTAAGATTSLTGLTAGLIWDFARYGTPGNEYMYAGNGTDSIKRWSGSAWSSPASVPDAQCLAVQASDNRLVAGGFTSGNTTGGPTGGASTSSPSHVYFSDPGTGETWTTNNFVQLTPGDGESIMAVVAWREFIFVFKESRFFVFYGNSVDGSGNPIFNYRTVDAGVGALGPRAVVAGRDGVYFVSRRGVYRTNGQEPQKLSDAIDPFFDLSQTTSDFYLGGTQLGSQVANVCIGYHNERVYVGATTNGTTNNRTLVYDPEHGWWSLWDIPASCFASFRVSSDPELVFGYATGSKYVGRQNATYTNDDGTAITSRWRSGWFDFGVPDQKRVRGQKVWGTGSCFLAVSTDFEVTTGSQPTALDMLDHTQDTWGGTTWGGGLWSTPRGLTPVPVRFTTRGTVFSTSFSNAVLDQAWTAHRLEHLIPASRRPSAVEPDAVVSA